MAASWKSPARWRSNAPPRAPRTEAALTDSERAEADAELRALQARLHAAIHRFHDTVHDFNNVSATVKGEVDLGGIR